jgi:hypothetical protein
MKKILLWGMLLTMTLSVFAQAPKAFKYQAIARDEKGDVIGNKQVGFRFSIRVGSETGKIAYSETWNDVKTNEYGLITLEIGKGKAENGNFASIQWSEGSHFVAVEMDPDNGSKWQPIGTSQLLSVPYALHAITVETVPTDASLSGKGSMADPLKIAAKGVKTEHLADGAVTAPKLASMSATAGQVLKWNGTQWSPDTDLAGGSNWTKSLFGLTYTGGNVGIGSTNVSSTLTLHGGLGNTELRFFNNSAGSLAGDGLSIGINGASPNDAWLINREKGNLRLGTNNKTHLTIDSTGMVYVPGVTILNQLSFNYNYSSAVGLSIKGIYQQVFERIDETPLKIKFPGIDMSKIVILNVEVGWIANGNGNFYPDRYRSLKDGIWYDIAENPYFNNGFEGLMVYAPDKPEYWFMPVRVTYMILH